MNFGDVANSLKTVSFQKLVGDLRVKLEGLGGQVGELEASWRQLGWPWSELGRSWTQLGWSWISFDMFQRPGRTILLLLSGLSTRSPW